MVPIPKRSSVKGLNDLRPVALITLVMRATERIIKKHMISVTDPLMDPFQLPYRVGRGVNDAKTFIMEKVHKHQKHPSNTTRLLFPDFSSPINTLQPHILAEKLSTRFHLDNQLIQ